VPAACALAVALQGDRGQAMPQVVVMDAQITQIVDVRCIEPQLPHAA
jgi:hypothetical protein